MSKTQVARYLLAPGGALGFLILFGLGAALTGESINIFAPYIDTEFAPNYSPDKFERVTIGMSEGKVQELIGAPLHERRDPYKDMAASLLANEAKARRSMGDEMYQNMRTHYDLRVVKLWTYTNDGKLMAAARLAGRGGYSDFAWYRSSVSFDSAGVVIAIDKGWSYD